MDLFDLFDKYNNNTLTEKDILLYEFDGYKEDWKQPIEVQESEEIKEEPRKFNRKISKDHHQVNKQRFYR